MKINKKNNRKNRIIIFILFVVIIVAIFIFGAFYYLRYIKTDNNIHTTESTIDYNPPTEEQKKAGEDIKKANQTTVSATFSALITSANVNNNIVQIRAIINGVISSDGICDLTLSNNDLIVTKSAPTYAGPSSSTCQGFDISRSELTSGTWSILLTVTVNNEITTATSEITLE